MKNKTWQKIGEVLLDYSKILLAIGVVSPFVNNVNLNTQTNVAIIMGTLMISGFGIAIYNKGAKNEQCNNFNKYYYSSFGNTDNNCFKIYT